MFDLLLMSWPRRLAVILAAVGLVACSSPEEKVASFYKKGKTYLEQGDLPKARLEFQNALQINAKMVPAIYGLAEIAERNSDWQKNFGLLNRVLELEPKHLDANLKLGRLLLAAGQLDKALVISDTARGLSPDSPDVLALRASVLFKLDDRKGAIEQANAALLKAPGNVDALVVLASERLSVGDAEAAIKFLDRGLASNEKNVALQLIKVQALEKLSKVANAEEIFRKLISFYPDNKAFRHILSQFYVSHGEKDKAEAEYRAIARDNPKDVQAKLDVVRFVGGVKGMKAAIPELEKLIKEEPGNYEYQFALAGVYQTESGPESAEKIFKDIVAKAGDSSHGLRAKGLLAASLLNKRENQAGMALVAEILAKDGRNEQGLLLRAGLAIDDRKLEDAIADLRTILRDVPDSARAHALLAKAHELAGSKDLAADHYSRAFQASKLAAPYGLSYASFLVRQNKAKHAEDILKDVLRVGPGNIPALKMLAQVYLNTGNMAGAQAVADEVAKMSGQGVAANQIQGAVYAARKNYDNSISSFKRAYELSPSEVQPVVALVRTYLRSGKTKEALAFMNSVVEAAPNNIEARLLLGQLYSTVGDKPAAKASFEKVIAADPKNAVAYQSLVAQQASEKQFDEADKLIARALAAIPNDFGLRLSRAGIYEATGRIDEAISLYEALLKERPGADVVVNNLASLISEHRTDQASLKRAHELSQRLKKSDIAQFKDTVGWASYKVGKLDEAASLINAAVDQEPGMAVLLYHQGMTQLALANKEAARQALKKALDLAKEQPFPQVEQAKKTLQDI